MVDAVLMMLMFLNILALRYRKNSDWYLYGLAVVLSVIGLISVASATMTPTGLSSTLIKQSIIQGFALVLMYVVGGIDVNNSRRASIVMYLIALFGLILVATVFRHADIKGASRWIVLPGGFQLQPSEFAKIAVIVTMAHYLSQLRGRIATWGGLIQSLIVVGIPFLLVAAQPDLTTALVFLCIWFAMVLIAGARWQHLTLMIVACALLATFAWKSNVLRQYQKDRVLVLVGLKKSDKKLNYQSDQAAIAVGAGGFTGQGWNKGIQNTGNWVPENQTDFIFTVIAEESGFVGSVTILILYGALFYRGLRAVVISEHSTGRLVSVGVVTMLAFHVIVNVGMNCGLLPVAGVPLPLISQGGSSAITTCITIGLMQSAITRKHALQF
jgi:rod shape determining protein RodA